MIRAFFGLWLASALLATDVIAESLPNVIIMMADDMGMGDTSAYQDFTGNSDDDQIHTPSMERLARMGVRFTDAHTPSTRCTATRYGLLTGRYPWRSRLKHWVLFGVHGDPLIEQDRPTIGTMLQRQGYRTGMVGKWHLGLRYRRSDGGPADAWEDADLTKPLVDSPLDHGFHFCRFTSRSHGTSGPSAKSKNAAKRNGPKQSVGPGHVHGRTVIGATGNGKRLVGKGPDAYVLSELGGRHLDNAMEFMRGHLSGPDSRKPFFLYYASNSNHGPYTPDSQINGAAVVGASRSVAGAPMNVRSDFIYENDVVLGQLLDYLARTDDPRTGQKLIGNTIVVFTSDNGAEIKAKTATGPFRSNKGSVFEGGHRVPFLVAWPDGGVGDGDDGTPGRTDATLINLKDLFATLTETVGSELPDAGAGQKGGEDSHSVLAAWRGERLPSRPMMINDHNEASEDKAVVAIRMDDPVVDGRVRTGQWKLFFDPDLLRRGIAQHSLLYDLATDPRETTDLSDREDLKPLVQRLTQLATLHRTAGGHRLADSVASRRIELNWRSSHPKSPDSDWRRVTVTEVASQSDPARLRVDLSDQAGVPLRATIVGFEAGGAVADRFDVDDAGLGVGNDAVNGGESLAIHFDRDVLIESAAIRAGDGVCGGSYRVGDHPPMPIYCVDDDIDSQDQSSVLSDLGVLPKGQALRLESRGHLGVESPGDWRLDAITIRTLRDPKG